MRQRHLSAPGGHPPGQRRRPDLPRFGCPRSRPLPCRTTRRSPSPGRWPTTCRLLLTELDHVVPRTERVADRHCVATRTATGLRWSGVSLRLLWEQVIVPRCEPADTVVAVIARGADGVRAVLDLRDALADDVMLADRLDGEPLDALHGAPLRLVSPGQYGYKSIKHLTELRACRTFPAPGFNGLEHPRARVALEERHPRVDGRLLRLPYRALVRPIAWLSSRSARSATRG